MSAISARLKRLERGPESDGDRPLGERICILVQRRHDQLTADERDLETYYVLCHAAYPEHTDANSEKGKQIRNAINGDLLPVELDVYYEYLTNVPPSVKEFQERTRKQINESVLNHESEIWSKYAPPDLPFPSHLWSLEDSDEIRLKGDSR